MATEVRFEPLTNRGPGLLDALEARTDVLPFSAGARTYALSDERVGSEGFDVMLDRIDPDWREHLTRT
jgi:hypothetical protein